MLLGIGVGIGNNVGLGLLTPIFNPATLFAAGQPGAWYEPSDITTLYQDTLGTTAVSTTGQSVARVNDKSGRSNNEIQPTFSSRPIYQRDAAGFACLVFDGVGDAYTTANGGGSTSGFIWSRVVFPTGGGGTLRTLFSDAGLSAISGYKVQINAANQLSFSAGNALAYTTVNSIATVDLNVKTLLKCWDDGINLNVQVNSGPVSSVPRPAVSAGTMQFTEGTDNVTATVGLVFFPGNFYSMIYRTGTPATTQDLANISAYNRNKAGI